MPARRSMNYQAPWWLPGGHAQTIWSAMCARHRSGSPLPWRRERWTAPDGDFVDVDFLRSTDFVKAAPNAPLLVLFHGLEGSSASHYAQAFADVASQRGWQLAVPHFRGCSGEINLAPRAYHSGDFEEVDWLLRRFAHMQRGPSGARAPLFAAGVSMGGNALARWAGEMGESAGMHVDGVATICSPLDVTAGGNAIDSGINRHLYARLFLRTMIPKALAKLAQHPGLFDADRLRSVRDLHGFDDVFTAPVHGFRDADDYWRRASAKPLLAQVRVPMLLLNARNDPFVPAHSLPTPDNVSAQVQLWQPEQGGHVGFASGAWPGHVLYMPAQVCAWFAGAQCIDG